MMLPNVHVSTPASWRRATMMLAHRQPPRRTRSAATVHAVPKAAELLPQCRLPNGLCIKHNGTLAEVLFLYEEVQHGYLAQGVALREGDVVLDVGANVGLFTMLAAEAVGSSGCVVSVEPAPTTAAALAANVHEHAAWCARRGTQVACCRTVCAAASDADAPKQMQLTTFKGASGWASLVRDDADVVGNMQAYCANLLSTSAADTAGLNPAQQFLVRLAGGVQKVPLLCGVSSLLAALYVRLVMLREVETLTVPVTTVSDIIEDQHLTRVDLLKIDVERAEMQVLHGIQEHHWPLIRQVVMEVHDMQGRLRQVVALLQAHGLQQVVWEQPPHLKGSNLFTVYAVRLE